MPLSNYMEANIVNWVCGATAFPSAPANRYVALSTTDPGEDGSGITEPSGAAGYARQAATFAAGAQGANAFTRSNSTEIAFGPATASWGTITHAAIFDAVSGGNLLYKGPLTTSRAVGNGDTFRFAVGQLTVGAQ